MINKKERRVKVEAIKKQVIDLMKDFVHGDASETQEYSALLNAKIVIETIMNGEDDYAAK